MTISIKNPVTEEWRSLSAVVLVLTTGYQNLMLGISARLLWRATSPPITTVTVLLFEFVFTCIGKQNILLSYYYTPCTWKIFCCFSPYYNFFVTSQEFLLFHKDYNWKVMLVANIWLLWTILYFISDLMNIGVLHLLFLSAPYLIKQIHTL